MMMHSRFLILLALLVPLASPPAAYAQSAPQEISTSETRLERLFQRLREAPSKQAAEPIANQIERSFERSGSDTADLLLQRVKIATAAKDYPLALDLIDHILPLRPDWAEAYHKRAVVHFLMKDEESAIRDVRATLAREPRHFQALAGLGAILRNMGNKKAAYSAFQKVVEIYPHFDDLSETLTKMKLEVEGQPI